MRRRTMLKRAGWAAALLAGLDAATVRSLMGQGGDGARPTVADLARALRKAKALGIGSAALEGPDQTEVASLGTWTLIYTAGRAGIQPGGGIRIGLRHLTCSWTALQNQDPAAEGYLSIHAPAGVEARLAIAPWKIGNPFFGAYFPVQHIIEVAVGGAGLRPGQSLQATFGDTSGGSAGLRVQPFDEERFIFKTFIDAQGKGEFLPLAESPTLRIVAGPAAALRLVAPSDAAVGRPTPCVVRVEDAYGNPAAGYRGTVRLAGEGCAVKLPAAHPFAEGDRGAHRFEGIVPDAAGTLRLTAADGQMEARGNPIVVHPRRPETLVLWGDLHGHSILSDGRGTPEEYYDFARRVAGLDFAALSDHDFELTDEFWRWSKRATHAANQPGEFTTFNAWEWSGTPPLGGDHNVYWLDEDPPLYRCTNYYDPKNYQLGFDPETNAPKVTDLFARLRRDLKDKNVFCIPHRGGRPGNPAFHDPEVQRLVECCSEHFRSFEWAEGFLKRGHRLGIMAASDGHYGNPGYGFLNPKGFEGRLYGEGLVAVLAPENARGPIFTALYDRHCYATSGERIVLDFRVGGALMGSEIQAPAAPEITVKAAGTAEIDEVRILKDGVAAFTARPGAAEAELRWRDPAFSPAAPCRYSVHLVQRNGEEAWSSPVWVN